MGRTGEYWGAALGALALALIAAAISVSSMGGAEPVLSSITVVATAFAIISWAVKLIWSRTTLIFWGLGIETVADVVPLAGTNGSTWSVWTIGLMMLGSVILANYMEFLYVKGIGPGFELAEERRARLDMVLLAFNGAAFYAIALVAALLLFLSVPLLTLSGVSVWLIGILAIGFMVLLTWLARSEPS